MVIKLTDSVRHYNSSLTTMMIKISFAFDYLSVNEVQDLTKLNFISLLSSLD